MSPAARAANVRLLNNWADVAIGTRVVVRQWEHPTTTLSEPWINANGVAVIRVSGWGGVEIALERVSFAGPPTLRLVDVVRHAPRDARLAFIDRPSAIAAAAVAFVGTLAAVVVLQLIFRGSP